MDKEKEVHLLCQGQLQPSSSILPNGLFLKLYESHLFPSNINFKLLYISIGGQPPDNSLDIIAGKIGTIVGRRNCSDISLNTLVDDCRECWKNKKKSGYCFLAVLTVSERSSFLKLMRQDLIDSCYRTRSIGTKEWIRILGNIDLDNIYFIYRLAYIGEDMGFHQSTTKCSDIVLMYKVYGKYISVENSNGSTSSNLLAPLLRSTPDERSVVHLLIKDNHLFRMTGGRGGCIWANTRYGMDDTEDEIGLD